ncbi:hypothetical protein HanXRQr2_Chr14g0654481 [Helianthus annuus]|uniref:Uncharacterized protein n=1 Tax=Helianthus annuus TaxID=4232 RepID=A0A9K3ECJ6_HELAN|nr:hypothetical protein HanXRQr2_Chr14g0654481 [Helianthus annuus]
MRCHGIARVSTQLFRLSWMHLKPQLVWTWSRNVPAMPVLKLVITAALVI